jgi:hypothetical protein
MKAYKTLYLLNDEHVSLVTELCSNNEGKLTIMTCLDGSSSMKLEGDYFDGSPEEMLALAKAIEELASDSRLFMQGKRPMTDRIATVKMPPIEEVLGPDVWGGEET